MNILHQLAPIISVLQGHDSAATKNRSGLEAANTRVRDKGDKAKQLLGKIYNEQFILLSGTVDIYEAFGIAVQITQNFHLLPHERLDLFDETVSSVKSMAMILNHKDCPTPKPNKKCLFAQYHADKMSLKESKKIRELTVLDKGPKRAAGLQLVTRKMKEEMIICMSEDVETKTDKKLKGLIEKLANKLETEVYSSEEKKLIEKTRVLLDLPSLALKLKQPGSSAVKTAVTEFPIFWRHYEVFQ